MTTEFDGKTVGVVGLARSGVAAAKVLHARGAAVRVYDGKAEERLDAAHVASVRALGVEPEFGVTAIDYAGLDVLVTSPGVPKNSTLLQGAVAAGVPVWSEIEAAYRVAVAPILAVTGTNGKTTTTMLLGEMLRAAGIETYIAGNIAAGDIAMPLIEAAHIAPATAAIAAEVSSFQLEWTSTFRPKAAALLNITPDHGDRQTWEEYFEVKWRIFAHQTADDFAIIASGFAGHSIGRSGNAVLWIADTDNAEDDDFLRMQSTYVNDGGELVINHTGKPEAICNVAEVKLPGAHNLENILAAAAMAAAFGVPVDAIRQVATTFTGVVHRLETVDTQGGVRYINNSMCTNAAAFERSLEALPEPKVVIAGGVFKGDVGEMAQVARSVVRHNVRALVLIGRSAPALEDAVRAAGFSNVRQSQTLADAVAEARALAHTGDTVLLAPACASFDMFRDFEDRGMQFKHAVLSPAG